MPTLISIAVVVGTAFGAEWLVGTWPGEDRRFWFALAGVGMMVVAGVLVKASGIREVTRILRNAVIGAGIGSGLRRLGLRLPWLRNGLRIAGVETEPEKRLQAPLRWSGPSEWLLRLGWVGSLIGAGLIWTGLFAG